MPLGCHLGNLPAISGLTRPGSYLNEWAESQNCFFTGHQEIKTAVKYDKIYIETAVKYAKNR